MKASQLLNYAKFCIENSFTLLVKGKPGIGKSDILADASVEAGRKLMISHPVVSDPTDFKGLPAAINGKADFLPFGDLRRLIETQDPLTWFIDDLGQAPVSVQASIMQILLAREINGHKISDKVSIIAATNRKEDKAGVTGLLEPVKSRFRGGIVELEVDHKDWVRWALNKGNMPLELIAFIRFKPDFIDKFEAKKDLVNTASPRTIASVGMIQNAGIPQEIEREAFGGIAGEEFATEYHAFLKAMRELPSIDQIIANPKAAKLPNGAGQTVAICGALANRANPDILAPIITYVERIKPEFAVGCLMDAISRHPEVAETREYINWSLKPENQKLINI